MLKFETRIQVESLSFYFPVFPDSKPQKHWQLLCLLVATVYKMLGSPTEKWVQNKLQGLRGQD